LNSILSQSFKNFEVLCLDGMSKDNTRKIIKEYGGKDRRIKLILNPEKLPEGKGRGKWLGYKKASGEIVAIIDQDNVLQRDDLFEVVINLFKKENNNLVGILGGLTHDKSDSFVVRYISLVGTDSFFAYRSVDYIRTLNGNYFKNPKNNVEFIEMELDNINITGGNCFFYRKKDVLKLGGYDQDILLVQRLVKSGMDKLAIINDSTKHYAEKNIYSLMKKKFMWGKSYYKQKAEKFDYFPKTKKEKNSFYNNLLFNLLIFPNLLFSFKIYKNSKDWVSFIFPLAAFINTLAYGSKFLKFKLF